MMLVLAALPLLLSVILFGIILADDLQYQSDRKAYQKKADALLALSRSQDRSHWVKDGDE